MSTHPAPLREGAAEHPIVALFRDSTPITPSNQFRRVMETCPGPSSTLVLGFFNPVTRRVECSLRDSLDCIKVPKQLAVWLRAAHSGTELARIVTIWDVHLLFEQLAHANQLGIREHRGKPARITLYAPNQAAVYTADEQHLCNLGFFPERETLYPHFLEIC